MSKIVVKEPGKQAETREVDSLDLKVFQALVGGYIENVFMDDGLALVVNEEGLIRDLPLNICHPRDPRQPIMGTVVATAYDAEGETRSLTDDEAELVTLVLFGLDRSSSEAA